MFIIVNVFTMKKNQFIHAFETSNKEVCQTIKHGKFHRIGFYS